MICLKHLLILSIIFSISACASLSKEECLHGNWYEIGYHDGKSGFKSSRISEHREACQKYHVAPDQKSYNTGRKKGLISYCTPDNGLQTGLRGGSYQGVCPHHSEQLFLAQYREGKAIYDLEQEIKQHQSKISTLEGRLSNASGSEKPSREDRRKYKNEINELFIRIEEKQKRLYYMKGKANVPM